ncbi:DUF6913 domain-containing protein [Crocinitomix catalasitica]|uniref:DUF6913 domain-containing protein n=1 Tax=Crocinitomix catalasitica TaxID=184607 RepID=UPI000488AC4B|nr:hypothetical protein [Crocinitomix catalasitica]
MIKQNSIKKKVRKAVNKRYIQIRGLDEYKNVLVLKERFPEGLEKNVKALFPKAKFTFISERKNKNIDPKKLIKKDHYTVHLSDFNLTGILKNDNLNTAVGNKFDLALDLSQESLLLQYIMVLAQAELIVGKISNDDFILHDLLIEPGTTDDEFLKNVKKNIILLSNNGNK